MAVLYFYIDESGKHRKNPVITVSGVGATSDRLSNFNDQWTALLHSYGIGEPKMSRAGDLAQGIGPRMPAGQSIEDRTQAILPFADCINEHMEIGLMQGWDVKGYNNLPMEVKRNLGGSLDPFYLCFVRAMLQLGDMLREEHSLSIVCGDDEVTAYNSFISEQGFVDLANNLAKDKLVEGNGASKVRQNDAAAYSGAAQRDKSQIGSGGNGKSEA